MLSISQCSLSGHLYQNSAVDCPERMLFSCFLLSKFISFARMCIALCCTYVINVFTAQLREIFTSDDGETNNVVFKLEQNNCLRDLNKSQ